MKIEFMAYMPFVIGVLIFQIALIIGNLCECIHIGWWIVYTPLFILVLIVGMLWIISEYLHIVDIAWGVNP